MSSQYPNLLIGIGASADGLPPLLEIIDHLSVSYQGAIFVAIHRPPDSPNMLLDILYSHMSSPRRRGYRLEGYLISGFPRSRE